MEAPKGTASGTLPPVAALRLSLRLPVQWHFLNTPRRRHGASASVLSSTSKNLPKQFELQLEVQLELEVQVGHVRILNNLNSQY